MKVVYIIGEEFLSPNYQKMVYDQNAFVWITSKQDFTFRNFTNVPRVRFLTSLYGAPTNSDRASH